RQGGSVEGGVPQYREKHPDERRGHHVCGSGVVAGGRCTWRARHCGGSDSLRKQLAYAQAATIHARLVLSFDAGVVEAVQTTSSVVGHDPMTARDMCVCKSRPSPREGGGTKHALISFRRWGRR